MLEEVLKTATSFETKITMEGVIKYIEDHFAGVLNPSLQLTRDLQFRHRLDHLRSVAPQLRNIHWSFASIE